MEIRWESVGKIAAGALLAVAIVVSLPSLFASEQPDPLPADVGLPQPAPPPSTPVPDPAAAARAAAKAARLKAKRRRLARRAAERTEQRRKRLSEADDEEGVTVLPLPPAPSYVPSPSSPPKPPEFGFETG